MPHIDPIAKPADEREIKAFKAWAKYPVPDDYLAFLRECNGGYMTGNDPCFYNSDDQTVVAITTFMHISKETDRVINKIFEEDFNFYSVPFQTDDIQDNYYAPDHYIKIASGAAHSHILMDLKTGHIFSFDDETEEELETTEEFLEECFIIADSFAIFYSQIVDEDPEP
ncbi:SMI1 / KNR4 family protein [Pseudovibrio sp. W64]|uniref:SMI1/KNR4 family protein n=1 Tax=Pseudovibrio sp. W64 TaxID=1735583 RepID=UPI0007AEE2FE|nr:SMI1/KNR4 family protein [Pseudovibrio sp. W64]KZK78005.1 SMI1 / KNR4 family protein [Pseudovibrio sp. W64]